MNPDEQLTHRIQRGDADAFTTLVERHYRPLLGYLYHMLNRDAMLAEDMVQEAFLRMMHGLDGYDPARPFKPWLYAIAANLARDHHKRADTRHTIPMSEDAVWDAGTEHPEVGMIDADSQRDVSYHLMSLPPHQREVLILRYYHELSLQEISTALGIPLGTVKSRLSLGMRELKARMEEEA